MRVAVLGAGRMGQALAAEIADSDEWSLAGVWVRGDRPRKEAAPSIPAGGDTDLESVLLDADVAIDFTLPAATSRILEAASRLQRPLVCGVTGLDETQRQQLRACSREIPLLYDRNMSLGIAVMTDLAARAAASLGPGFRAAIHETHHLHKKDAPSGTALQLGEALARARQQDFSSVCRFAGDESAADHAAHEIVITSERRGEVAGEHSIELASAGETLTLGHVVTGRRVFAAGALRAAKWLLRQPPGLYAMCDIVLSGRS